MQSNPIIVLEVEGEYGHFRKFNTTTSPLTYSIPPRTAIVGMIGAILGIEREQGVGRYLEGQVPLAELLSPQRAQIAVQVLRPVQKVSMAFNLINTKNSFFNIENRTQIEFEYLKNPKYRIFLQWDNAGLSDELVQKVSARSSHFTVCLGLSQLLATTSYVGTYSCTHLVSEEFQPVLSAVKMSLLDPITPIQLDLGRHFRYTSDTQPIYMTPDRLVMEYAEVLIEATGKPIRVKSNAIFSVDELGNILFL
jgi:CRISPR-associated protein Cas5h